MFAPQFWNLTTPSLCSHVNCSPFFGPAKPFFYFLGLIAPHFGDLESTRAVQAHYLTLATSTYNRKPRVMEPY